MRRGVPLLGIVLIMAALVAAAARAAGSPATTTPTSTTTTGATTTTAAPTYAPLKASPLPPGCVGAGVAAITGNGQGTVAVAAPASNLGPSDYPRTQPFLTLDSATVSGSESECRTDGVTLNGVSLFGGAVTASSIRALNGRGTITGLAIDGSPVSVPSGGATPVESWGILLSGAIADRLSAPLALRLLHPHGSLPAGTTIYVGFGAIRRTVAKPKPAPVEPAQPATHRARHLKRKHAKGVPQPLKVTPPLGIKSSHYVFPVDGGASYSDTYGANRSDIYDGWHHGDDLFAPLGTPVVAVTSGKLSPLGWDSLGGWRLWLTDKKGNSFYYAHLAGYARWILTHRTVRAGEVLGFLGRTGDAFTTTPHLHFEVHPHQLIKLGYDGAVDPTGYLKTWRVEKLPASKIPIPARLRAPKGQPAQEAAVVWGELLATRHLMPNGEPVVAFTAAIRRPFPDFELLTAADRDRSRRLAVARVSADVAPAPSDGPWPLVALGVAIAASALGAFVGVRRRRARAVPR
jgi:hypothetical protein